MEKKQMEINNSTGSRIKFLSYRDFVLWDVKRYLGNFLQREEGYVTLKSILTPFKKKISHKEVIESKYQIISKINFGGNLFLRNFEEINTYKGDLYLVPQNAIIFSKINARHGCIYFHQDEKPFVVSNEYPVFLVDLKKVNGEYLNQYLRSSRLKEHLNSKTTGISKARIKSEEFLSVQFPLKPLSVQQNIISAYYKKLNEAKRLENELIHLNNQIGKYIFEFLGIKKAEVKKNSKGLNFVKSSFLKRWGVEGLLNSNSTTLLHSTMFENKPLSLLVNINPTTLINDLKADDDMTFLPMECISDIEGEVIEKRNGKKSLSKGYTKFQEGDLIWARITPCMENGKSAIMKGLANGVGYGSTEYHVLRQKTPDFLIEYVYHLLRLEVVRKDATSHFTGSAGQQRVPKSFLENLIVPVPPNRVQVELNGTLSKMKKKIKKLRIDAEENRKAAIKEFEQAIFKN